ncbi:hypothetical protein BD289DRAFT_279369 [Coniella lustricola]|uniref:Uncharacterized protein n=1 Tax=Coniella lustricola TaxID=2025994 RepID=A0A2T3A6A8_9PEZI|nr:hypothetical protein BD289DRAFT_279369 [Coniella lustricola]
MFFLKVSCSSRDAGADSDGIVRAGEDSGRVVSSTLACVLASFDKDMMAVFDEEKVKVPENGGRLSPKTIAKILTHFPSIACHMRCKYVPEEGWPTSLLACQMLLLAQKFHFKVDPTAAGSSRTQSCTLVCDGTVGAHHHIAQAVGVLNRTVTQFKRSDLM